MLALIFLTFWNSLPLSHAACVVRKQKNFSRLLHVTRVGHEVNDLSFTSIKWPSKFDANSHTQSKLRVKRIQEEHISSYQWHRSTLCDACTYNCADIPKCITRTDSAPLEYLFNVHIVHSVACSPLTLYRRSVGAFFFGDTKWSKTYRDSLCRYVDMVHC